MYLEFNDGTQLQCIRILGGPRVIKGVERDCLSIEVEPQLMGLGNLESYFLSPAKMTHLYTRELTDSPKQEIGEGYMYLIGCREEIRKAKHTPGLLLPESFERVLVANIAQVTYDEYQEWLAGRNPLTPLGEYIGG